MHRVLNGLLAMLLLAGMLAAFPTGAQANCTFTGTLDELVLYRAPVAHASQRKDALPGGVAFRVVEQRAAHYLIAVDDAYGGWVDQRSGILNGDCAALPLNTTPVANFPTICSFRSAAPVPLFDDAQLTQVKGQLDSNIDYVVAGQADLSVYVMLDHAYGGYVRRTDGALSGDCAVPDNPAAVYATENARLWSEPNVKVGHVAADLIAGEALAILSSPTPGSIRFDTDDVGYWYQARRLSDGTMGWLWEARLTFAPPSSPAPVATAIAGANARVWTQPDVFNGAVIGTLTTGSQVNVVSGPARGRIQFATNLDGDWYYIEQGGVIAGWVWVERLQFQ